MTDDGLQAMWVAGAPLSAMVQATGRNKVNLMSHIRRLRTREGEQRWPRRAGGKPRNPPPPHIKRAPATTLPPLPSLAC